MGVPAKEAVVMAWVAGVAFWSGVSAVATSVTAAACGAWESEDSSSDATRDLTVSESESFWAEPLASVWTLQPEKVMQKSHYH